MAFSETTGRRTLDDEAKVRAARSAELAAVSAKEKAQIAKWDINIAVFLFAVLIIVVILLFEGFGVEVVGPIAAVGLGLFWLAGWRRGKQLYRHFLNEELLRLQRQEEQDILREVLKAQRESKP